MFKIIKIKNKYKIDIFLDNNKTRKICQKIYQKIILQAYLAMIILVMFVIRDATSSIKLDIS